MLLLSLVHLSVYYNWQLAHIILYICLIRLLIVSTHLGITWQNGIVLLTLTVFFCTCCQCKKETKSTSALKSSNNNSCFKYFGQLTGKQSFELELYVYVSIRSWARSAIIYHLTSNLILILFTKSEEFKCGMSLL